MPKTMILLERIGLAIQRPFLGNHRSLGWIKVNVDAGIFNDGCGIGVVARDHNGLMAFCAHKYLSPQHSIAIGEARTVLYGISLSLSLQMDFCNIVLETDCLELINQLQRQDEDSYLSVLSHDIQHVSLAFQRFSCAHVPRKVNLVAHSSANHPKNVQDERIS